MNDKSLQTKTENLRRLNAEIEKTEILLDQVAGGLADAKAERKRLSQEIETEIFNRNFLREKITAEIVSFAVN